MLQLDPQVIAWLAIIANLLVQLTKGLYPESFKKYIPISLAGLLMAVGLGLAWYTGRDVVAGAIEGFFAACSAVGLYEMAGAVPGVSQLFHSDGWISRG